MSGEVPTPDYRALFGEEVWDYAVEQTPRAVESPEDATKYVSIFLDSLLASGALHVEYRGVDARGNAVTSPTTNASWVDVQDWVFRREQRLVGNWTPK